MVDYRMAIPKEQTPLSRGRRDSLSAEQHLCLEALESADFDSMSDHEWVALCENVADSARSAIESN
jgi:hypothetical protein